MSCDHHIAKISYLMTLNPPRLARLGIQVGYRSFNSMFTYIIKDRNMVDYSYQISLNGCKIQLSFQLNRQGTKFIVSKIFKMQQRYSPMFYAFFMLYLSLLHLLGIASFFVASFVESRQYYFHCNTLGKPNVEPMNAHE